MILAQSFSRGKLPHGPDHAYEVLGRATRRRSTGGTNIPMDATRNLRHALRFYCSVGAFLVRRSEIVQAKRRQGVGIPQRGLKKTASAKRTRKVPFPERPALSRRIEGRISVLFRGRGMKRVSLEGPSAL